MIDVRSNISDVLAGLDRCKRDVLEKAIPRALNRTAEMARTEASRSMRGEGYSFSSTEIKDAITVLRASTGRLVSTLKVRRKTKSLMDFSPRESKAGVTVKVLGQRKLIKGAFIAQLRNGTRGVYIVSIHAHHGW